MNRMRLAFSLLLVTIFVMVFAAPAVNIASAQGGGCTLSEEDCALLEAGLASISSLESVNVSNLSVVLTVDAGAEGSADISLSGAGPIVFTDGIAPFETDMVISASIDSPEESTTVDGARLVIKDDVAYTFDPETGEWDAEEATAEDFEGMEDLDLSGLAMLGDMIPGEGVVVYNRLDNVTMGDAEVAVYTIDVMLGELVQSEEFLQLIVTAMEATGEEDAALVGMFLTGILAEIGGQLNEGVFQITTMVGTEDQQIYGLGINMDMTLDLSFLGALAGDEMGDVPPVSLFMDFDMEWDQHNSEFAIEVPAEAMEAMQ